MKVLTIAPQPFFSPRGTPFSVYYRALVTSQLGIGMDLLTNFQFTTSRLLIGGFKMLEDSCLKEADAIITICPDLADYVNGLLTNFAHLHNSERV